MANLSVQNAADLSLDNYVTPGRGAKYCAPHVCLSADISETIKFSVYVLYMLWISHPGTTMQNVMCFRFCG